MQNNQNIIYRNFFAQLANSYFKEKQPIQKMSPSKWRELHDIALRADIALDKHTVDATPITSVHHQLLNRWMERRRQRIFEAERHAIDTSVETLRLLNIIIYNVIQIEHSGVSLTGLITLGQYLRTQGHRVDFVKLDTWIQRLQLKKMSSLLASILIDTLNFEASELPFLYHRYDNAYDRIVSQLSKKTDTNKLRHSSSYLVYSPLGFVGFWLKQLRTALDNIEE